MGRFPERILWRVIAGGAALTLVVAACGGGEAPAKGDVRELQQATAVASDKATEGQAAGVGAAQATGAGLGTAAPAIGTVRSTGSSPGQAAIAFTLPSARGPEVSLAGYQGSKHVVLVFYRAFW